MIFFISKDELLTKTQIKYLESRLIQIAIEAKSAQIENGNSPSLPTLHEADISDMLKTYFDNVSIMVTSNDSDAVNRVAYVCEITVTTQNDRYQTEKTFFDDKSLFRRLTNDLNSGAAYA